MHMSKTFVLFSATLLGGAGAANTLYTSPETDAVTSWDGAKTFCEDRESELVTKTQLCEYFTANSLSAESWSPALDHQDEFFQIGASETDFCIAYNKDVECPDTPVVGPGLCHKPADCNTQQCAYTCDLAVGYYPDANDCRSYCYCTGTNAPSRYETVTNNDLLYDPWGRNYWTDVHGPSPPSYQALTWSDEIEPLGGMNGGIANWYYNNKDLDYCGNNYDRKSWRTQESRRLQICDIDPNYIVCDSPDSTTTTTAAATTTTTAEETTTTTTEETTTTSAEAITATTAEETTTTAEETTTTAEETTTTAEETTTTAEETTTTAVEDITTTPDGEETTTTSPGSGGDPHFQTFGLGSNTYFDFHGGCDLVLGNIPSFANGVGLFIQLRTTTRYDYSFIESAAIKIGEDILEISSFGQYIFNGISNAVVPFMMSGYPVIYTQPRENQHRFTIVLSDNMNIMVKVFKDLVYVSLDVAQGNDSDFEDTVGLMGSWKTGARLARDGVTILEDPIEFGQEWQVREDQLFMTMRAPQYPAKCEMPNTLQRSNRRRLGESISAQAAAIACVHIKEGHAHDMCVFDVIATNDLTVGQGGAY